MCCNIIDHKWVVYAELGVRECERCDVSQIQQRPYTFDDETKWHG